MRKYGIFLADDSDMTVPSLERVTASNTLVIMSIVTATVLLWLGLWYVPDLFLLTFAGILLAVFLHGLTKWASEYFQMSHGLALALVVLLLLAVTIGGILLLAPQVIEQGNLLIEKLPQSIRQIEDYLKQYPSTRFLLRESKDMLPDDMGELQNYLGKIAKFFTVTISAVGGLGLVLVTGVFLAVEPKLYTEGIIKLVPQQHQARAREVMDALEQGLRWWLLGRMLSMIIIGIVTAIGLLLMKMPLALSLGVIAGILDFIPNIGPIVAAVPAVLLAFSQGLSQVLYVILLYFVIQHVEAYLLLPVIQQRTVNLPPALVLITQVLIGVPLGVLGLMLATPLTLVVMILVQKLYIEPMEHEDEPSNLSI